MTFIRLIAAAVLLAVLAGAVSAQVHTEILEVQAVPEAPAAARQLQQSSDTGGTYGKPAVPTGSYGSVLLGYGDTGGDTARGRNLIQAGGYGGVSTGTYGFSVVHGGYNSRGLIELDAPVQPPGPLLEYAQQQRQDLRDAGQLPNTPAAALASSSHLRSRTRSSRQQQLVIPTGTCYCRYDTAFSTWALAEDSCREALYARAMQADSGLPSTWLDSFYAPSSGAGYAMPHEADIKAFLFQDCKPHPPCACSGISFDGTDPVPEAVACCRDLRVACKTPYSSLHCSNVEAFCADDTHTPLLAAWSQLALLNADCSSYSGIPYQLTPFGELLTATATATAAAAAAEAPKDTQDQPAAPYESALLAEALRNMGQQAAFGFADGTDQKQRRLIIALAAVAAGAACVAITAVVLAMRREDAAAAARPITSQGHLTARDVYQSFASGARLAAPKPAACLGIRYSSQLPPLPPLRRDGSGDSCLSRVTVTIGRLSGHGSGVTEPLLGRGLDRSLSNSSDASTGSTTGGNMP